MDPFGEMWRRHEELTRNFAQLLHDDAGQVLTAIALRLSALDVPAASRAEVQALQADLDDLLERFRAAQAALGAAAVAKRGLAAGLSQLARSQGSYRVEGSGFPSWNPERSLAAFRIIEALAPRGVRVSPQSIAVSNTAPVSAYHYELARRGGLALQTSSEGNTIFIQHAD
jgi:hypothetical protein